MKVRTNIDSLQLTLNDGEDVPQTIEASISLGGMGIRVRFDLPIFCEVEFDMTNGKLVQVTRLYHGIPTEAGDRPDVKVLYDFAA